MAYILLLRGFPVLGRAHLDPLRFPADRQIHQLPERRITVREMVQAHHAGQRFKVVAVAAPNLPVSVCMGNQEDGSPFSNTWRHMNAAISSIAPARRTRNRQTCLCPSGLQASAAYPCEMESGLELELTDRIRSAIPLGWRATPRWAAESWPITDRETSRLTWWPAGFRGVMDSPREMGGGWQGHW